MNLLRRAALSSLLVWALGCPGTPPAVDAGAPPPDSGATTVADAGVSCTGCVQSSDCVGAVCAQVAGTDGCFVPCGSQVTCPAGFGCEPVFTSEGTQATACVPMAGCGGPACPPICQVGTTCDPVLAHCVEVPVDGGSTPPLDGGAVGGPITGSVGLDGGHVSRLYFAVVGDTRPAIIGDTANYPTATITGIFDAIQAMDPRPEFVIGTGDYAFASPLGGTAPAAQLDLYLGAAAHFTGPVFPAMGNHECTGATAINCTGLTASTSSLYSAYLDKMVKPMGHTLPYYTFDVNDLGGAWTAKFIVTACNAWDPAQLTWLQGELTRPTTYTFVIRHIPLGIAAPCTTQMDAALVGANYTGILVGHTHTYSHSGKQLVEGVGGAPLSGSANFGYATVEQLASGQMQVTQYESATRTAVSTFLLP